MCQSYLRSHPGLEKSRVHGVPCQALHIHHTPDGRPIKHFASGILRNEKEPVTVSLCSTGPRHLDPYLTLAEARSAGAFARVAQAAADGIVTEVEAPLLLLGCGREELAGNWSEGSTLKGH